MGNTCSRRSQPTPRPKSRLLADAQASAQVADCRKSAEVVNLDASRTCPELIWNTDPATGIEALSDGTSTADSALLPRIDIDPSALNANCDDSNEIASAVLEKPISKLSNTGEYHAPDDSLPAAAAGVAAAEAAAESPLATTSDQSHAQDRVTSSAASGSSQSPAQLPAFRALILTGDTRAIELVMRIVKEILQRPNEVKYRSLKLKIIEERVQELAATVEALKTAGFTLSDGSLDAMLTLPIGATLEPLRDFLRAAERTRGVYWTPTQILQPVVEIDPDSWGILVSPESGGYIIGEKDAEQWSKTFRRTGNEARTWRGGQTARVTVTFMNWSGTDKLICTWIDTRSLNPKEERWDELPPKRDMDQRTFVSHAWVLRLPDGRAVAGYVPIDPGPAAHHFVAVGRHRDLPSVDDFEAEADRRRAAAVEKAHGWRDTAVNRVPPAMSLPPRSSSEQWAVAAYPTRSGMEVPEAEADTWAATHRSVGMEGRNWRGANTQRVNLVFVNCASERASVSWLDIHNNMRERYDYDIEPQESRDQGTWIYHAFVFRDGSGRAVGGYVPMDVSDSDRHVVFFGPRVLLPQGAEELQRKAASLPNLAHN
eukprot:TRINITY_DN16946_c1_g1_i1.p1 TRINITY_DN16946_c1_g1~~TRINITY_DN16946_c1_g1_i1.p1  ORF type:complete len:599 (+),score=88.04 TRINITY_DN16946_c1_g1_i1:60-1856(+)